MLNTLNSFFKLTAMIQYHNLSGQAETRMLYAIHKSIIRINGQEERLYVKGINLLSEIVKGNLFKAILFK